MKRNALFYLVLVIVVIKSFELCILISITVLSYGTYNQYSVHFRVS